MAKVGVNTLDNMYTLERRSNKAAANQTEWLPLCDLPRGDSLGSEWQSTNAPNVCKTSVRFHAKSFHGLQSG